MGLSKSQILDADDLPKKTITVEEWGGDITLRCLTGQEASDWFGAGVEGFRSMCTLIAKCAIDGKGKHLFDDDDVEALGAKNPNAIRKVFEACLALSRLDAGADEEAEKN